VRVTGHIHGFSLIELVAVITIIGLLAATSIPRFTDLVNEANEASFEAVRGAFTSGISLANAKALSTSGGIPNSIIMGGVPVDLSDEGWPAVSQTNSNCDSISMYGTINTGLELVEKPEYFLCLLGISSVYAMPGGGGGGGDPCSVLELVVSGKAVDDWTISISDNTVIFTDSFGRSFTYNETTGDVN